VKHTAARMEHHLHTGLHEITHWLYDPAAWGRNAYRIRFPWLHVHLIPGRWMTRACDRYDRRLGLSEAEIRRVQPTGRKPRSRTPTRPPGRAHTGRRNDGGDLRKRWAVSP
jgi:hypothetical protein